MSLISKQIDDLRACSKNQKGELAKLINDAAETIETLSAKLFASQMERSIQYYHGGWIPCNERSPEANEEDDLGFLKAYLVQDAKRMDVARWDGKHWIAWGYGNVLKNVIAWRPLPDSYREVKE